MYIRAKIVFSRFAVLAFSARNTRLQGNSVPNLQGCNIFSNFDNGTSTLMSQNEIRRSLSCSDGSILEKVHIRTTDSTIFNFYNYLICCCNRHFQLCSL